MTPLPAASLALALLLAPRAAATPAWGKVAPLPFGRSDVTATPLGSLIYLAGGCDGAQKCANNPPTGNNWICSCSSHTLNFVAYSPATDTYATKAPMLRPRYRHVTCPTLDETRMVVFGGRAIPSDAIIPSIDVYSVAANAWTSLAVQLPSDVGSDNSCTTAATGDIYVMGGYDQFYSVSYSTMYKFVLSPAGTAGAFTLVAPMPLGLGDFSSTLDPAGLIHVLGGYSVATDPSWWFCRPLRTHLTYSPKTGLWTDLTATAPLPVAQAEKDDALLVAGRLFVVGGESKTVATGCSDLNITALAGVYSYDLSVVPSTAAWRAEGSLPEGEMRLATAALNGVIYLFGGQGPIIDRGSGGETIPISYDVRTYTYNPLPPVPEAVPFFPGGTLAGAVVATFVGTLLAVWLVNSVRARLLRARGAALTASDAIDLGKV